MSRWDISGRAKRGCYVGQPPPRVLLHSAQEFRVRPGRSEILRCYEGSGCGRVGLWLLKGFPGHGDEGFRLSGPTQRLGVSRQKGKSFEQLGYDSLAIDQDYGLVTGFGFLGGGVRRSSALIPGRDQTLRCLEKLGRLLDGVVHFLRRDHSLKPIVPL